MMFFYERFHNDIPDNRKKEKNTPIYLITRVKAEFVQIRPKFYNFGLTIQLQQSYLKDKQALLIVIRFLFDKLRLIHNDIKVIYALVIVMLPLIATAQIKTTGLPFIKNYSSEDYNATTENWCVEQDNRGIMYFANGNGILEFDGAHWTIIPTVLKSEVRCLAKDGNGRIYVGSHVDLGYIESEERGIPQFHSLMNHIRRIDRDFNHINKIHITEQGVFFVSERAIFIYKNYTIKRVIKARNRYQYSGFINHKFYTLDEGEGIVTYKNNKLINAPGGRQFKDDQLHLILRFDHNRLLFVFRDHGFMLYDGKEFTKYNVELENFVLESHPSCGINYGLDDIIIGTTHNGIFILNKSGKLQQHINLDKGLNSNRVFDVFEDKDRNVWLALENGISKLDVHSPFTLFNQHTGIGGAGLSSTFLQNKLYLGTSQGLFFSEWTADSSSSFSETSFTKIDGINDPVFYMGKYRDNILMGTQNGTYLYSPESNDVKQLSDYRGGLKFIELESKPGYLLQGYYDGILVFRQVGKDQVEFLYKVDGFDERCEYIEEDQNGHIWVSQDNKGLWKLELDAKLRRVKEQRKYIATDGLPFDIRNKVFKIHGEIVFATEKGIYKYRSDSNRFYPDTIINKYIGDLYINRLFQDKKANIWYEAARKSPINESLVFELGMLKRITANKYQLTHRELLKFKGKNLDYVASVDAQHVILGMENGFIHYDLDFQKNYEARFDALIRKVECTSGQKDSLIFGGLFTDLYGAATIKQPYRQRHFNEKAKTLADLNRKINELKKIADSASKAENYDRYVLIQEELNVLERLEQSMNEVWASEYLKFHSSMNSFRFVFAANFYENSNKTQYQYWLKNLDNERNGDLSWSPWSNKDFKEYTNLKKGTYEFHVRAKNVYGNISEPVIYRFAINEPWHESTWFNSIQIAFLMLLMIASFYLNRSRKLYKVSSVLTLLVIISIFEFITERLEIELSSYSGGVFFFTILMNVILAMSLLPLEHMLRKRLRRSHQRYEREHHDEIVARYKRRTRKMNRRQVKKNFRKKNNKG